MCFTAVYCALLESPTQENGKRHVATSSSHFFEEGVLQRSLHDHVHMHDLRHRRAFDRSDSGRSPTRPPLRGATAIARKSLDIDLTTRAPSTRNMRRSSSRSNVGSPHTGVDRRTPAWPPLQSQRARRTCTSTEGHLVHRRDEEVNTRRSVRLGHSFTTTKFGVVARRRSSVQARRVRSACSCALPRSAALRHCHGLHTRLVRRASWRLVVWLVCAWT